MTTSEIVTCWLTGIITLAIAYKWTCYAWKDIHG